MQTIERQQHMKPESKKQQTVATATTSINLVSLTPSIDLASLTPEQLKQLRVTLREASKTQRGDAKSRNELIDSKLREKDNAGFMHTTSDILAALQVAKIVPATLTSDERAAALKMIQTRKQALVKDPVNIGLVGFKPTPTGIGALTVERATEFLVAQGFTVTKK